jgi:hypothetical protein
VREILESLPEDERVAYTTVQTLVYRLEEKAALRKVKKIGNAQLFRIPGPAPASVRTCDTCRSCVALALIRKKPAG